jgi:hypothetical protein
LVGLTLPRPNQLHVMVRASETFDQSRQCEGYAIHFRRVSLRYYRYAP